MIPVLAPSGVQEYLDLGLHGYAMSRYSGSWMAFKALDDTVECSASVSVDPARVDVRLPEDFALPPGGLGLRLPDQPLTMERRIHEQRLPAVLAYARANRLNVVVLRQPAARGSASSPPASPTSTCARRSSTSGIDERRRRAHRHPRAQGRGSPGRSSRRGCTRSRWGSRRSSSSRRSVR